MKPRRSFELLALLVLSTVSCAHLGGLFQKPTVTFRRFRLSEVTFSGMGVVFVFGIDNPNAIGLDLARLGYQLTIDGHDFAESHGPFPLQIPANGTAEFELPLSIRYVEFAQSLAALFQKQNVPYGIATQLGFDTPIGAIDIPLQTSGNLPVPQLPRLAFTNARVGAVGLRSADLEITLAVANPNSFAIPLGALRYRLGLSGATMAQGALDPMRVEGGASQSLRLPIHIDFLEIGMGAARALTSGTAEISFEGSLDLAGYSMPIALKHVAGG